MFRLVTAALLCACALPASSISCGPGNDLINGVCADPCINYITLDQPWRSAAHGVSGAYNCDGDKQGWYRFVGSGGTRLATQCVPTQRCNTASPAWMNGADPNVTDGIVTRQVCANWNNNCCLWSSNISVKNCSAGYLVYNISGSPGPFCSLSYCTDPNGVCAVNQQWDGSTCTCIPEYNATDISQIKPNVTCGSSKIIATLQNCQMTDLRFYIIPSKIKNADCFTFINDTFSNTLNIEASLKNKTCRLQPSQNATHVIYSASIFVNPDLYPGAIIQRNDTLTINIFCAYPLDMRTSLDYALVPWINNTVIDRGGTGQFPVTMALYHDSGYTSPYSIDPGAAGVTIQTKTPLYVGLLADVGDNETFVLVMKNCYATPSSNYNDSLRYYIIQNSCPNPQDYTVKVSENGVKLEARFEVQMFKFIGDGLNTVYLHCNVSICNKTAGACQPSCSGKSLRSSDDETVGYLTLGPLNRDPPVSAGGARTSWPPLTGTLLLLCTILLKYL